MIRCIYQISTLTLVIDRVYAFFWVLKNENDQDEKVDDEEDDDDDEEEDEENAVPEYKQLIAIHAGKPKGELQKWLADAVKVKRLSLSEQELEKAVKTHGTDIVRLIKTYNIALQALV